MEKGKFKFWWENHDFSAAATTWVLIRVADPDPGVFFTGPDLESGSYQKRSLTKYKKVDLHLENIYHIYMDAIYMENNR